MKTLAVGNTFLLPTTDDFVNGYQAGYRDYLNHQLKTVVTDKQLITLIMARLEDTERSEPYCVGYVVGWITAFSTRGMQPREEARK